VGLGVLGSVLVMLVAATLGSSWVWSRMLQPTCRDIARPDLSLQEMVDVKLKVDESERQGSAPIRLSGREATFVLRDVLRLPMRVDVEDDQVHFEAAMPYRDACYNIDYQGRAALADGVATLEPSRFRVGDLDVTNVAEGPTPIARLGWVSPDIVEVLGHLESLEVEGAELVVHIDDVRALR
jgi:hypothetical protein